MNIITRIHPTEEGSIRSYVKIIIIDWYVIQKSFPPLLKRISRIIKSSRLGGFWLSLWRRYGHDMLEPYQVEWIIRAKEGGMMTNGQIASVQNISERRVRQLFSYYKRTGTIPVLKKAGRPKSPDITEYERKEVIKMYGIYRLCACYLEDVLLAHGIKVNHGRIHRILREEGLALNEPKKHVRKKWIRYEREYSNSLWHVDWHKIKDPRWRDEWLVAYEDDSSRLITAYGTSPTPTAERSVEVLDSGIARYGRVAAILSDHVSIFYAVEAKEKE